MALRPRQGEVWWARLDPIEGSEQARTRPVLIVSVDQINHAPAGLSIVMPITTTERASAVRIELITGRRTRVGWIEPYQVRTISHTRLGRKIGQAPFDACQESVRRLALFCKFANAHRS